MRGLVYDAGALIAAESRRASLWALHDEALTRGVRPMVPSPVLAQAWRGGPQANLSRLLRGCVIEAFAENAAREVGRLLAVSHTSDVVDAAVVVSATTRNDLVITSDPDDLRALSAALGVKLDLYAL